jgi:AcrR family transcriptional regulator
MTDSTTQRPAVREDADDEQRSRRATKKERTRALLIEAAAEVIAERGFHAASLMEIASRAGVTTGAVYSNFRNKEDLFLAVIRKVSLPFDLGPETATPWERLGRAARLATRELELPASRRLLKLQLEFALVAMQDQGLMHDLADDIRVDRQELAALLVTNDPTPAPALKPSADQLATAIIATVQGLQQHHFLDPDSVPEELAGWAVQALLHVALGEKERESER